MRNKMMFLFLMLVMGCTVGPDYTKPDLHLPTHWFSAPIDEKAAIEQTWWKNFNDVMEELSQMPALIRSIPIVILTGHEHFEYIKNTYPICVMSYINKPCHTEELKNVLMRVKKSKDPTLQSADFV